MVREIIKRPKKFSGSNFSLIFFGYMLLNLLRNLYKKLIPILGIQPTSPIRERNDFDKAIIFQNKT